MIEIEARKVVSEEWGLVAFPVIKFSGIEIPENTQAIEINGIWFEPMVRRDSVIIERGWNQVFEPDPPMLTDAEDPQ